MKPRMRKTGDDEVKPANPAKEREKENTKDEPCFRVFGESGGRISEMKPRNAQRGRATAGQEEGGRQNHGWQNHDFAPDDFAQAPFPETADLPAVIAKMNELITALRR